jgi:uncharacterized protein YbjT (DUF2867 family)
MPRRKYAVMGATGHIGAIITADLIKRGHEVRAIARTASKLEAFKKMGATTHAIAFDNAAGLTDAFRGVDGAFTMLPPSYDSDDLGAAQDRVGLATVEALTKAGVPNVIFLSSVGAHLPEGTGPIKGLYRQEKRLDALKKARVLSLRPAPFMENQFFAIPLIRAKGINGAATPGEIGVPYIATPDIGHKTADLLDRLDFPMKVLDFCGPRAVTMREFTTVLGRAIGHPDLKYVEFSYEETKQGMIAAGMKPAIAEQMVEMYLAGNEGKLRPVGTPVVGATTIEDFARTFAGVYKRG